MNSFKELSLKSSALIPQGSIEAYLRMIHSYPMLTAEQEKQLGEKLYYEQDVDSASQLILSHLRFVAHIARGYSGYGLPQADLIQEGNIGLMKAVKKFNPEMGVRLVSFAVHWIKAEIHEFVIKNWRIVKVATTKSQRKLFFNLRKNKKRLGWFTHEEVKTVASELGVSEKDVLEMESRMSAQDLSFDMSQDDDDNNVFAPAAYLEDQNSDFSETIENRNWEDDATEKLTEAFSVLDDRSQDIIKARWLDTDDEKSTLSQLAKKYNVSAERIRQIEKNAIQKMRHLMV